MNFQRRHFEIGVSTNVPAQQPVIQSKPTVPKHSQKVKSTSSSSSSEEKKKATPVVPQKKVAPPPTPQRQQPAIPQKKAAPPPTPQRSVQIKKKTSSSSSSDEEKKVNIVPSLPQKKAAPPTPQRQQPALPQRTTQPPVIPQRSVQIKKKTSSSSSSDEEKKVNIAPSLPQKKVAPPPTPQRQQPALPQKKAAPVLPQRTKKTSSSSSSDEENKYKMVPSLPQKRAAPPTPQRQQPGTIKKATDMDKKEMRHAFAEDTKEIYGKLPDMTDEQKQQAKAEAKQAGKTAYSGGKKVVQSDEFKQGCSQAKSGAKAAVHSQQFKAFSTGLAAGTKAAARGDANAKDVWKSSTKDVHGLTDEQKKDLHKRKEESGKLAKQSYQKASQTEEWAAAKEQGKRVGHEVYESEQFKVAKQETEKKTAQRMTGREDAEFNPDVQMETSFKPKMVTDETGKKKMGVGVTVKPKLVMDGDVVDVDCPTVSMDETIDPKLKKNADGSLGVDMNVQTSNVKVSRKPPPPPQRGSSQPKSNLPVSNNQFKPRQF